MNEINITLLRELEKAHAIIRIALNLMTPIQKAQWMRANEANGLTTDGATRANEREEAILSAKRGMQ